MNSYTYRVTKASLIFVAWLCLGNDRLSAGEWKERFLDEGVRCLRELEELTFWLQATVQHEQVSKDGKTSDLRESCFQGAWMLSVAKFEYDWDKVPPSKRAQISVEVVRGINSRYEFRLRRPKEGPLRLIYLEKVGKDPQSDPGPYTYPYAQSLSASWILNGHPLQEWLATDGFSVDTVEPTVTSGGRTSVKVNAKYAAAEPKKSPRDPEGDFAADVLLDPEDHWCIRGVNYIYDNKGPKGAYSVSKRVSIEYGPPIDGKPVPRVVTEVVNYPPASGSALTVTDKSIISNVQKTGTVSEDQFMLSRFGLPEVDLGTQGPISWTGYLLIGLSVIGALAAIFLAATVAKRRRKSTSNA